MGYLLYNMMITELIVVVYTIISTLLAFTAFIAVSRAYDPFEDMTELGIFGGGVVGFIGFFVPEKIFGFTVLDVSANVQELTIYIGISICILIIIVGSIVARIRRANINEDSLNKTTDDNKTDDKNDNSGNSNKVDNKENNKDDVDDNKTDDSKTDNNNKKITDKWEEKKKEVEEKEPRYIR